MGISTLVSSGFMGSRTGLPAGAFLACRFQPFSWRPFDWLHTLGVSDERVQPKHKGGLMKRFGFLALALLVVVMFAGVAFASKTNTGCGLGYMIFKGQEGLASQTCAATTNGTFGNQTFGITTGTSECDQYKQL